MRVRCAHFSRVLPFWRTSPNTNAHLWNSGPARHRINRGNACFYGDFTNSILAVTPRAARQGGRTKTSHAASNWRPARSLGLTGRTCLVARITDACVWPQAVTNSTGDNHPVQDNSQKADRQQSARGPSSTSGIRCLGQRPLREVSAANI